MVKSIQCFEDSKGNVHKDAYAAHRADLAIWLEASGLANPGTASALASMMAKRENAITLIAMLNDAVEHAPPEPEPVLTPATAVEILTDYVAGANR